MSIRRVIALALAVLLAVGTVPALAAEPDPAPAEAPSEAPAEPEPSAQPEPAEEPAAPAPAAPVPWYSDMLDQYASMRINVNLDDGQVHIYAPMDRYDFVRTLLRALRVPVDERDPAAAKEAYLQWARDLNLLTADQCTDEGLAAPFCRYEMCRMLYTVLKNVRGETVVTSPLIDVYLQDFFNAPEEAKEAVNACYVMGVVRGEKGKLNGWYGMTRSEGLLAILRLITPHNRYYVAEVRDPNLPIARGNMVIMMNHALGIQLAGDRDYRTRWAAHSAAARAAGCLPAGDAYGEDMVGQSLSRYDLAVLLDRLMVARGEARSDSAAMRVYLSHLEDIPAQYKAAVENCTHAGVLLCDGDNGAFDGARRVTYKEYREALRRVFKPAERISPELDGFTKVVGSYTSLFKTASPNSAFNARHAAQRMGAVILQPGATLNINKVAGDYSLENGFRASSIYSNGSYIQGEGGGVCQTSSTLYAAAVYANLGIVERHNHADVSTYIPAGLDATVYYPTLSLIVRNTYDQPVKIVAESDEEKLTFYVLGREDLVVPKVEVSVVKEGKVRTLTRTADGVVNYTAVSKYR